MLGWLDDLFEVLEDFEQGVQEGLEEMRPVCTALGLPEPEELAAKGLAIICSWFK